jgi:hypothetical protein
MIKNRRELFMGFSLPFISRFNFISFIGYTKSPKGTEAIAVERARKNAEGN